MAGFTRVNLKEVEDLAPGFGYAPGLESRFARASLGLSASGLSYFRYAPRFRMPFGHRHTEQEEIYVVLSGGLKGKLDDEFVELGPWDAVRVAPGTVRAFEAGPEGAEVLVFGAPSHANRDVEVLPGWWRQ
jgi:mannose-6-phosphate isomerase-like protein (cupin superfamily)